ncbi:MAG: FKBP-type peptidyl-prolyl cis-trans isomerase, partial [Planctomycetaceae bacterium]|nr:FKBP-type peptidyl-prolyl cis-trans isomerase [Planctomycetaceae bacterium]
GTLDDGTVFDSSEGHDPMSFTLGNGEVIDGFDNAIEGMNLGDKKTERFEPANAYGDRREDLVFSVPKDQIPEGTEIEIGDMLQIGFPDGSSSAVTVAAVQDDSVTLDANHPLAGKALTFELELVRID